MALPGAQTKLAQCSGFLVDFRETRNDNEIVKGGGLSLRIAQRWREDLELDWGDMPSTAVHKEADKEHSDVVWEIFEKYAVEEAAYRAVIEGAGSGSRI